MAARRRRQTSRHRTAPRRWSKAGVNSPAHGETARSRRAAPAPWCRHRNRARPSRGHGGQRRLFECFGRLVQRLVPGNALEGSNPLALRARCAASDRQAGRDDAGARHSGRPWRRRRLPYSCCRRSRAPCRSGVGDKRSISSAQVLGQSCGQAEWTISSGISRFQTGRIKCSPPGALPQRKPAAAGRRRYPHMAQPPNARKGGGGSAIEAVRDRPAKEGGHGGVSGDNRAAQHSGPRHPLHAGRLVPGRHPRYRGQMAGQGLFALPDRLPALCRSASSSPPALPSAMAG